MSSKARSTLPRSGIWVIRGLSCHENRVRDVPARIHRKEQVRAKRPETLTKSHDAVSPSWEAARVDESKVSWG